MRGLLFSICMVGALLVSQTAHARDEIRVVGSSTVYPFVTVAAEAFGNRTNFSTPIVEATGTGGGMKLFCDAVDTATPDFVNASRRIKASETARCKENGVTEILEIKLGYDGIVLANDINATQYNLTKKQLFLALAKEVPSGGELIKNPYTNWQDISPSLPNAEIQVYGPPPTSGTRDAFVELVMEEACVDMPGFIDAYKDKDVRKKQCHMIREDGAYIEAGENDNLIIQKLASNPKALGIFGFSFLDQNLNVVHGAKIDGVLPTFENIASGEYGVSRPLYVYAKTQHIGKVPGIQEFIEELTSEQAIGDEGYLVFKGLIPLGPSEYQELKMRVSTYLAATE